MTESKAELKSCLLTVKEEWKRWLKTQHSKHEDRGIWSQWHGNFWQMDGETMETVTGFIFLGSKITSDGDYSHKIKRRLLLGRKAMTNLGSILKSRDISFPTKVHIVKTRTVKKAECWRIDAFELWCWRKLLSPLDSREIKPVNPKGNQSWMFIGSTDAEAEAPILWPPDSKSWLIEKDPDAGKDWRQEKGTTEDEMIGWHHRLNGHEPEQAPGDGEGLGSLACCSPWSCKESDMTEQLNNTNNKRKS